mmetsp:Transcript_45949/g.103788  ORF Transcript_45949/g.103788 Transcript_45949/m.103788 type:complete len:256 (+) Transcript_45949:448-1215(+)
MGALLFFRRMGTNLGSPCPSFQTHKPARSCSRCGLSGALCKRTPKKASTMYGKMPKPGRPRSGRSTRQLLRQSPHPRPWAARPAASISPPPTRCIAAFPASTASTSLRWASWAGPARTARPGGTRPRRTRPSAPCARRGRARTLQGRPAARPAPRGSTPPGTSGLFATFARPASTRNSRAPRAWVRVPLVPPASTRPWPRAPSVSSAQRARALQRAPASARLIMAGALRRMKKKRGRRWRTSRCVTRRQALSGPP